MNDQTSKSSSNGAVTGGIVAGLVGLLVVVVLIVYVFKKRRLTVIRWATLQAPFKSLRLEQVE